MGCVGKCVVALSLMFTLAGCGTGLMVYPILLLSVPSEMRVNDCYEFSVRATNVHGEDVREEGESRIEFEFPSSAKLYSSQLGCRTYNATEEVQAITLDLLGESPSLYLRADTAGDLTLTARSSAGVALTDFNLSVSAQSRSFTPSGGPDQFNGGRLLTSGGNTYAIGDFLAWGTQAAGGIFRLDSDLQPQSTLAMGTGFDAAPTSIALQSDGRVLVGGSFTSFNGTARQYLARLNADGSLDGTFQLAGSGLNGAVTSLGVQPDGRLVVGGSFTAYNGTARTRLARLNANGSLDTSFVQVGSGLDFDVNALALQTNGAILIAGGFIDYNGTSISYAARINANGSLDTGFAQTGTGFDATLNGILLQSDGRAVFVGGFSAYDVIPITTLARTNSDGTLDGSFAQTGGGLNVEPSTYALQSDGKILVGGSFSTYDSTPRQYIARLNSDGSLDNSFAVTGTGFDAPVSALTVQSDGKILVAGPFTAYNGVPRPHIARLNSDGSLDLTFDPGHGGLNSFVTSLSQDSNGGAVVGGFFSTFDGTARKHVARFDANGSLDTGFSFTGTGVDNPVYSLDHQPDGRLLIGGVFSAYNGTSRGRIARLLSDGALDTSFAPPGSGFNGNITHLEVLANGKILTSGPFTDFNGTARQSVARLLSDGSLDTSFAQIGTGLNPNVVSFVVQPDGKVAVVGAFTSYNGTSRPYVARLLADGSLDTAFATTGSGFSGPISGVGLQSDGKIVVGGSFTSYNGTSIGRVARIHPDGSLDPSFSPSGTGLNSSVNRLGIESDGKIFLVGGFTAYNGTSRKYTVRLNSDGSLDTTFANAELNLGVAVFEWTTDQKYLAAGWFTANGVRKLPRLARFTYNGTVD